MSDFQINTEITMGNLPDPEVVNETVAQLTGKPNTPSVKAPKNEELSEKKASKPVVSKPVATKAKPKITEIAYTRLKYGRPQKEIAVGRTKFTTMLQPEVVKGLKREAIDRGVTVADLLETILENYFAK